MKDISFELKIPKINLSDKRKIQIKIGLSLFFILAAFWLKARYELTLIGILILAYFGVSLMWGLSSRIAAFLALVFLTITPFLLTFDNQDLAEQFAIYAYYFLVITVIQEIVFQKTNKEPVDNLYGHEK